MAEKFVWQGKAMTRADGETLMPRQEFEPTDDERRSFGDLMRPYDKDVKEEDVVTSTPNPDVPDVPQKGMLHLPPMEEDGTEPEDMPKQVYHKMPPGQRIPVAEGEGEGETPARRTRRGKGEEDATQSQP